MKKSAAMKRVGPTGDYPAEGPIDDTDLGGLMAAVGIEDNKIRIEFGTSVKWLALGRSDALALAEILIQLSRDLRQEVRQ